MKSFVKWILVLELVGFCWCQKQPEVTTAVGRLKGLVEKTISGREVESFLGIPFAKPPTGNLRFEEPVKPKPWTGVFNATKLPPPCFQFYWGLPTEFFSEDCLYLNIYVPKRDKKAKGLLDVVFNIHGGGYQIGVGHTHGPRYLLDENDVILVTSNYRLGVLGFLSFGNEVLPGNNGLKDQNLALRWVNDNIKSFGGDPKKITITGFSSGGMSVHAHMLSPRSKGLFQKAFSMSGSLLAKEFMQHEPELNAKKVAQSLGCPVECSKKMLDCLKNKPVNDVSDRGKLFDHWASFDLVPFYPVIEKPSATAFIESDPKKIIEAKKANDVPFMFSYASDECLFLTAEIYNDSKLVEKMEAEWNDLLPMVLKYYVDDGRKVATAQKIKQFYLGTSSILERPDQFTEMCNQRYFSISIEEGAALMAKNFQSPGYAYVLNYTYEGESQLGGEFNISHIYKGGARHGDDAYHIFDSDFLEIRNGNLKADELSKYMIRILMDFVKRKPSWGTLKSRLPSFGYLEINQPNAAGCVFKSKPIAPAAAFWSSLRLNFE